MDSETIHRVRDETRAAYADAGSRREDDRYPNSMRCLSFLPSAWLDAEGVGEAIALVPEYNRFDSADVRALVEDVAEVDPDALFAFGREFSPVLYIETDDPHGVRGVWVGLTDELSHVDHDGFGPPGHNDPDTESHFPCKHGNPPVPGEEMVEPDPDRAVIRCWWD